ncbi:hypothetical protein DFP73DRAFT_600317 [Morchella snyderi]|nr:hypothetical protein DFP73DRAFT_600317 [Morchella snyderi]
MDFQTILNDGNSSEIVTASSSCRAKKRGASWEAWEDRALAKQVLADDPILNKAGTREYRWGQVSNHLKRVGMDRSWSSCRDRVDKLVDWHKKEETRSKQKTGAVELVDEHVGNMTECYGPIRTTQETGSGVLVSTNNNVREDARNKIAAKKAKAAQVREASKVGQVRNRDLMEEGSDEDSEEENIPPTTRRKKIPRAPKNQFAKEVEGVLGGLKEKAEEFRTAIYEKAERDRINSQQQSDLNRKLDALIDTT